MMTDVAPSRTLVGPHEPTLTHKASAPATRLRSLDSVEKAFYARAEQAAAAIPAIEPETLEAAVEHIKQSVQQRQRTLSFTIDEASGRSIITVLDKQTNAVIRQIPPAEVIAIAHHIERAIGLLIEDEV